MKFSYKKKMTQSQSNQRKKKKYSVKFSYKMKAPNAKKILVKGFNDWRKFQLSISGKTLGTFGFEPKGEVVIDIPSDVSTDEFTLEITPEKDKETPRVSEIRILK